MRYTVSDERFAEGERVRGREREREGKRGCVCVCERERELEGVKPERATPRALLILVFCDRRLSPRRCNLFCPH
eukprot:5569578-Pleurochrysis_carterae.AAC.2